MAVGKKSWSGLISLILISVGFSAAQAAPEWIPYDLKLGLSARSYPVGAQAAGFFGTSVKLWGDSDNWKYGYLRGAVNLATSAVVNRAGVELQFYPISILGFSAGYDWGVRAFTPKFLNCSIFECDGRVDRRYLKVNAVAAYRRFIFAGWMRYEELKAFHTPKPFFDEVTLLVGKNSGERVVTYNPALLYSIDPTWKVGAMSLYSHALDSGGYSHLYGPVVNWTSTSFVGEPQISVIGGVGLNRSPVVQSALTAFAVLQYTIEPSLSINDLGMRSKRKVERDGEPQSQ